MTSTAAKTSQPDLTTASRPFLDWLGGWVASLPRLDLASYLAESDLEAANVAVVSADLVEGFCYHGRLASPRIAGIVEPSAALFRRAYDLGVRNFALVQEYHTPGALEFEQFGPHCVRGTDEAETVNALKALPFSDLFAVIHKNSLHPALHTDLDGWLAQRPRVNTFVTVGDCTDLCLYQFVMHFKLSGNAVDKRTHVIVPANCAQTYDLPVETARNLGVLPHDGDTLHAIFLYHMALNGATVVREVV
jgi:nicotinamidase-related amidase